MSDDTPTERFDPAGDAPTERIAAADTAEVPSEEVVEERKSRRLILILGIIGGLLLIGVIILLVLLLTRGSGEPSTLPTGSASPTPSVTPSVTPSATPSATPTPTPTPTETQAPPPPPPPPSTDVEVTSFDVTNPVDCSAQTQNPVYLDISWTSTNGIAAYFGVNTSDAQSNGMGWTLPPNGNNNDFPSGYTDYQFQCGNESITYTITIVGTNGSKDSRSVTVENVGDTF